jgi:hypothetical protein
MTRKRMVGPGGGDFAPSISTAGGKMGGGKSIVTGRKSSVSKKTKEKLKEKKKEKKEELSGKEIGKIKRIIREELYRRHDLGEKSKSARGESIRRSNIKDNMKDLIKGSDAKKASKWSKKAVDDIAYGGKKR